MVKGLIGRKLGMTRVFDETGRHVPVTVLLAGPCVVLQVKTPDRDGYSAVQLGLIQGVDTSSKMTRSLKGHLDAAKSPAVSIIREFDVDDKDEVNLGDRVTVEQFSEVAKVDVTGTTKGKGFQGVVRRYGFGGGKATHGSMFHRAPGSVGAAAYPSRVVKGQRMPGQMGARRVTQIGLRVVAVKSEQNLLLVAGAVPGPPKGYVFIRPTIRG
ncbi:MAG: 50S ribosomal protein L3 [Acidobacteriota bacterium]